MAIAAHDIVSDSPTNTFATLNPLDAGSNLSFADGNCRITSTTNPNNNTKGSIAFTSGKYYFEYVITGGNASSVVGIGGQSTSVSSNFSGDLYAYDSSGNKNINGTSSSYNQSFGVGDIIGVFFNLDSLEITFLKNNSSQGVITGITANKTWTAFAHVNTATGHVNFGQDSSFGGYKTSGSANAQDANGIGSFYYQPPTGALALCTANIQSSLAIDPAVDDLPEDYFKSVIWTGQQNGGAYNNGNVTVGFQPDLVWIKDRTNTSPNYNHQLYDSVRGVNSSLLSNDTTAAANYNAFTSFNSNGFTVPNAVGTNTSSENIVSWCFRAGGNSNTFNINGTGYSSYDNLQSANSSLPASSTSGMITPSGMSIGTKQGFSIVKYTGNNTDGASIPHGLNKRPDLMIIKNLTKSGGSDWIVGSVGSYNLNGNIGDGHLLLNSTNQADGSSGYFTSTPTSNVIYLGGGASIRDPVNTTYDYIMYCWHSVAGYSAFGSYTGNGSADGPFVYTGFKPSFLIIKDTTSAGGWFILDNARNQYNPVNSYLMAHSSGAEDPNNSTVDYDFVSNGIKVRATSTNLNTNNNVYIFMAFSEQPFKYANAR